LAGRDLAGSPLSLHLTNLQPEGCWLWNQAVAPQWLYERPSGKKIGPACAPALTFEAAHGTYPRQALCSLHAFCPCGTPQFVNPAHSVPAGPSSAGQHRDNAPQGRPVDAAKASDPMAKPHGARRSWPKGGKGFAARIAKRGSRFPLSNWSFLIKRGDPMAANSSSG